MRILISYLLLLFTIAGCTTPGDSETEDKVDIFQFPVFVDQEEIKIDTVDVNWLNDGQHNPLYFGELVDTINVEMAYGRLYPPPPSPGSEQTAKIIEGKYVDYFLDWLNFEDYANYDSVELNIQIDTSHFIANNHRKAYPVIIENLHSDTIYIGYGRYIPIITEALNENGEWKAIEERYIYMCGNGVESIILPPKQIVVTSELVYTGEFKTKLRIKLGSNYSSEYSGSIHLTQFESEWDSRGNRKPLPIER